MSPPQAVAASPAIANWCLALDEVHDYLEEIASWLEDLLEPPVDLKPVGQTLRQIYEHLYRLLALSVDPFSAFTDLSRSLGVLESQCVSAGDEPHLAAAAHNCRLAAVPLEAARPTIQGMLWTGPTRMPAMRASLERARLHCIDREALLPEFAFAPAAATEVFDAKQDRPKPKSFGELREAVEALKCDAEARLAAQRQAKQDRDGAPPASDNAMVPGFSIDPLPTQSEADFRCARAREAFEEIAMIGLQRLPLLGDPWRSSIVFERRMFENLDALVALGDVGLAHLQALTLGAAIKDPSRLFALTLVGGCVDGRDTLALAERYFRREYHSDAGYVRAFVSALRMVPHPWVVPRCQRFLLGQHVTLRRVAVEVLAHKRLLSVDRLHERSMDEDEVAAVALPYFAMHDDLRVGEVLDRAVDRCRVAPNQKKEDRAPSGDDDAPEKGNETNPRVLFFRGVATALAIADHPHAQAFFWQHTRGPHADYAALMLGLTATPKVADDLLQRVASEPTPGMVAALSWAGPKRAVDALIRLLETSDDDRVRAAAGYGLERLTAGGYIEQAEVPPDKLEEPELPDPDIGDPAKPSLAARVSLPRDMPSDGSPDIIERPSTDPKPWREHWEKLEPKFSAEQRIRRGMLYSPQVSLHELDQVKYTPAERRALVIELVTRTGRWVPMDPEDLVVVQESAVSRWRTAIADRGRYPGGWDRAARRIR